MQRRTFLAALASTALARVLRAEETPKDVRITRAVGFELTSQRAKIAGRNAYKDVHGDQGHDQMVRLYTNAGVEALGNCRADENAVGELLGKNPFDFYRKKDTQMAGPLGAGTMPLWDLIGKLLSKPVYELLGGAGAERVPVYDGSIYFADLLPQYADAWQDRFRAEIDLGLNNGHRAFKIKIGRGYKWMPRSEGDARDIEVVKVMRAHAGPDVILGVDGNNGYDLAGAQRFMESVGDLNLAFTEEMFEERVDDCLAYKEFIAKHGWKTLVADGETQSDLAAFKPFVAKRAIEVYQGDMNHFGIEGIRAEAAMAREQDLQVAPHNWGSLVGYYLQLHVGRSIPNFYMAEHDPLSTPVLIADGYDRRDGVGSVPDAPGFGLAIAEKAFADQVKVRFDLKA